MKTLSLDSTVARIVTELPGAADLFRRSSIDTCRSRSVSLREAAEEAGLLPADLLAALETLARAVGRSAPDETGLLIDHLVSRYHDMHRQDLEHLVALSQTVERIHGDHPLAPLGLARALIALRDELEDCMESEEQMLFPRMWRKDETRVFCLIAQIRREHGEALQLLGDIQRAAHGMALPDDAGGLWAKLYRGLQKFVDDLAAHMYLEDTVLFPRFEATLTAADA